MHGSSSGNNTNWFKIIFITVAVIIAAGLLFNFAILGGIAWIVAKFFSIIEREMSSVSPETIDCAVQFFA